MPTPDAPDRVPPEDPHLIADENPRRVPTEAPRRVPSEAPRRVPTETPRPVPSEAPRRVPDESARRVPVETPRRVRVTSPRTSAARRIASPTGTREIDEQTRVGEVYMSSLIQSQLRLALVVIGGTVVGIGGLPLLFFLVPATRTLPVFGLPLPWLLLGVVIYPVVYVAARIYVRHAERIETEFTEFVGRQ